MKVTRPFGAKLPEYILCLFSQGAFDGSDTVTGVTVFFLVDSVNLCQILDVVGLIPLGLSENPRLSP